MKQAVKKVEDFIKEKNLQQAKPLSKRPKKQLIKLLKEALSRKILAPEKKRGWLRKLKPWQTKIS